MDIEATAKEGAEKATATVIKELADENKELKRKLAQEEERCMELANRLDREKSRCCQLLEQKTNTEEQFSKIIKNKRKEIRFMRGRHEILSREYHAVCRERDTLNRCVTILERVLLDEQGKGGTPQGTEAPAES